MPRNVRPSWIDVKVDERPSIGTGPVSRNGEMRAIFSVRSNGNVHRVIEVELIGSFDKETVLVRVTDVCEGTTIFEESFTQ